MPSPLLLPLSLWSMVLFVELNNAMPPSPELPDRLFSVLLWLTSAPVVVSRMIPFNVLPEP